MTTSQRDATVLPPLLVNRADIYEMGDEELVPSQEWLQEMTARDLAKAWLRLCHASGQYENLEKIQALGYEIVGMQMFENVLGEVLKLVDGESDTE